MRRIIGYLDVRIGGPGLISGGRLAARLNELIGKTLIEDLPVSFAAITTEVGSGHEVWLARGSLALALRASYPSREFFRQYVSAVAGWSMARWSIHCRFR